MRSQKLSTGLSVALTLTCVTLTMTGPSALAQAEAVLYNFGVVVGDGRAPLGALISDASGNLYGTTNEGGVYSSIYGTTLGTVFQLTPTASGGWSEIILHSFGNGADGFFPTASLVSDAAGRLYGTTSAGGANGFGTVFAMARAADGTWSERVLHSFNNNHEDGSIPLASLILDAAGNLYGTTTLGGTYNNGMVFELMPLPSGAWTEKVLHSFSGRPTDGANPQPSVIFDAAGNLYGTTSAGGAYNRGTAFELLPNGSGGWTENVLHTFGRGTDGQTPLTSLIFDAAGNLYGTTAVGGANTFYGMVFELMPKAGGKWAKKVLYNFSGYPNDGYYPLGNLVFGAPGVLYGTTYYGGVTNFGTVFKLTRNPRGTWTEKVVHQFGNGTDAASPTAGLILGTDGRLYGTTSRGGTSQYNLNGAAFAITP